MLYFDIDLGVWRKSAYRTSATSLSVDIIDSRESGRFYFISQVQLIIDNDKSQPIMMNEWKFSKMVELHDGTNCFNSNLSEKIIVKGVAPKDEDFIIEVEGKINGLDIYENLFNTVYAISCCPDLSTAKSLALFLRENSLSNVPPDLAFQKLFSIRDIINTINTSYANAEYIEYLKRIYKRKYKEIVQRLINEEPII